jgi:hypothetical protein
MDLVSSLQRKRYPRGSLLPLTDDVPPGTIFSLIDSYFVLSSPLSPGGWVRIRARIWPLFCAQPPVNDSVGEFDFRKYDLSFSCKKSGRYSPLEKKNSLFSWYIAHFLNSPTLS